MLRQLSTTIKVRAATQGLADFTAQAHGFVAESRIQQGLLTLFCRHTSASLLIQENAAPAARRDLEAYFSRIAPEDGSYEHGDEGADDMPAHLRAALTASHLSIPVLAGRLALGTWQGIYLFEHRRSAPEREIVLHLVGA